MNERIRELALQAGFETNGAICSFGNYKIDNEYFFAEDFIEDELAKFAELIVRECIQASEAHAKDLESQPTDPLLEAYEDGVVNGIYEATEAIKEHFGVEE